MSTRARPDVCHHRRMGRMGLLGHLSCVRRPALMAATIVALAPLGMPSSLAQPAVPPAPVVPGPAAGPLPGPAPDAAAPVPVPLAVAPAGPAAPLAVAPGAAVPGCPDIQVVFARGTTEPPGLGAMGDAFVNDLRTRIGNKTLGVYPVDYPASPDFPTGITGVIDASTHVQQLAANCPKTQMVLGGYSQGAAVMGFVTTELVPDGVSVSEVPAPMPADVANHIAAVALLGTPSDRFMNVIKQPPVKIGPLYQAKTLELCVPNDFVCSAGNDFGAHARYVSDGYVAQAADFAVNKLTDPRRRRLPHPLTSARHRANRTPGGHRGRQWRHVSAGPPSAGLVPRSHGRGGRNIGTAPNGLPNERLPGGRH